jgi:hypothetical protein
MPMNAPDLLHRLMNVRSTAQTEAIMAGLPIVLPEHYQWLSAEERSAPWQPGKLHWVPVGRDRGNGGRIKLAGEPGGSSAFSIARYSIVISRRAANIRKLLSGRTRSNAITPRGRQRR